MSRNVSPLEAARVSYRPRCPAILDNAGLVRLEFRDGQPGGTDPGEIAGRFPGTHGRPVLEVVEGPQQLSGEPTTLGVVLSGGQAPGGHNVIAGLYDGLQAIRPGSRLLGFLGGPRGILSGNYRELDVETLRPYRNTGGFDLIGAGRDKIESDRDLAACRKTCEQLGLSGLVVIGGDDSNTNAAVLAEYFLERNAAVCVNGVPKTIDGDLKSDRVEISFGFDTATKVYSGLIGNICRDALSAGKYWHFVKLMGRSASHVTLECALQTQPNIALIGEEVLERQLTLEQIVERIASVVRERAAAGKNYGVCLIPEGLIEFIPEMRRLIDGLNSALARGAERFAALTTLQARCDWAIGELSGADRRVFGSLPPGIQQQLLQDRDAHGNVQVSRIDTEQLLLQQVARRITGFRDAGEFAGKFLVQGHFFGYEGRCAAPSDFDANYTQCLGRLAAALTGTGKTGYMCGIGNLAGPPDTWAPAGVPLTSMMCVEQRNGRPTPVIGKALVRIAGKPFREFSARRDRWAIEDNYRYPGAIQYFGPPEISGATTATLRLERG